jgi:NitT/TauT family transport system substrate-binding protein
MGAASALAASRRVAAAEPPPEVSKIRLVHTPSICLAPQYLAEELLRLEGFTQVEYLGLGTSAVPSVLAEGRADISMWIAPELIFQLDAGKRIVLLAGVHGGCYELFGNERVQAIRDLKGKTIAVDYRGAGDHVILSSMLAYVGVNPQQEVKWIFGHESMRGAMVEFIEGRSDAFIGFPPQPQELRAKKVGHVIVNTAQDRPWSQYFCCMVAANKDFAQRNPVAIKRSLRAILKAADLCASEPQRVARYLSDKLYEPRFAIGLEAMQNVPYDRWRNTNPEDTIRFIALRLHEVGIIKSDANQVIARGTDWRFLNELKKELKS